MKRRLAPHATRLAAPLCALLVACALASCGASGGAAPAASQSSGEGAGAGGFEGAMLPLGAAHDFTLIDQLGRRAATTAYRGRVVVLAFLDTRCGAPCTLVAEQVRGALDQLAAPAPVLIVTIDPASDTPAAIARFLARVSLSGRARWLLGPARSLRAVWSAYRVPAPAHGGAALDRFEPVVLLDGKGRARDEYALETLTPESLAHDIRALEPP